MGHRIKRVLPFLFLAAGALLVAQAGSSLYFWARPVASPPAASEFESVGDYFEEGTYLGQLHIPRLSTTVSLIQGDSEEDLLLAPGHLPDTPLPGERGNAVIAGHRDTHFRVLKEIHVGDEIVVDRGLNTYRFRVKQTEVVEPTDTRVLLPTTRPTLTLITCYPFRFIGPAPRRFIVTAELGSGKTE